MSRAIFHQANLGEANLQNATLIGANFCRADLYGTDLSGAKLCDGNLQGAQLAGTKLNSTWLFGCKLYGMSAWDLELDESTKQENLIIKHVNKSSSGEHHLISVQEYEIAVDNIEVAQFVYLLLNSKSIRGALDTITSKVVLILGRFTPPRKAVLDALRDELRRRRYVPILFDFDKPVSKDLTGTVQTLANMARFVIADLTDPSSVPHELAMAVPGTVVPVQPVLLEGQPEYAMFVDLKRRYDWVLEPYLYADPECMIADLGKRVIAPAEIKAMDLRDGT